MVVEAACSEIGGRSDPDAAVTLPLPFPEKHFESQFEIALCHYGLYRASLQFLSQSQNGCDPLSDRKV